METPRSFITISRRKFLGLFLKSTAAAALVRQSEEQSAQFYTPPANLGGQWQFIPDPELPNVLLIGDSISLGYTLDVRRLLRKKANVFRPMTDDDKPENCGNTSNGLERIHSWLGEIKWSVVHFNWGLWDLCYRSPQSNLYGHRDKVHGVQDVPIARYREKLAVLVQLLARTKATLIWATTTSIPPDEAGRFMGDEIKYNWVAAEIMRRNRIR